MRCGGAARFLRGALPLGQFVLLGILPLLCGFSGGVLAPHLAAAAAVWLPPAAKEGQGDCDFPLGPPWILLYPLKRRRSARGRWRRGLAATRRARGRLGVLRRISAVVWEAAGAGRCAAGAGMISALRLRGVPAPGERERARRPSRALIEPGGVYAGFVAISSQGSLPHGEEIASFRERMAGRAACRPTNERVQARSNDAVV